MLLFCFSCRIFMVAFWLMMMLLVDFDYGYVRFESIKEMVLFTDIHPK